jgi:hypothetical protein
MRIGSAAINVIEPEILSLLHAWRHARGEERTAAGARLLQIALSTADDAAADLARESLEGDGWFMMQTPEGQWTLRLYPRADGTAHPRDAA